MFFSKTQFYALNLAPYTRRKLEKQKKTFVTTFQLQKTFTTKNCLIAFNKLHKTLVANVDEVNDQQNTSPFLYYCMSSIYYYKKSTTYVMTHGK